MTAAYPPVTGGEPCRRTDPERFFPQPGFNDRALEAAELCRGCRVLLPCLAYAIAANEKAGVWGGTTPKQRDQLRRMGRAA